MANSVKCNKRCNLDVINGFSKFYNSAIWAMTVSVFLGLWLWLGMRMNLGWVLYGGCAFLTLVLSLFRKLRFGWKFTSINVAVFAVLNLVVMGVDKLKALPAVRIREGLGQTRWHLGTVSAVWYSFVVIGLVVIVVCGILKDKKAKEQ